MGEIIRSVKADLAHGQYECDHKNARRIINGRGKEMVSCPDCHLLADLDVAWRWKITVSKLEKIGML